MGPGRSNGPANRDRGYRGISNQACKFGPKLVSFRKLAGFQNLTSLGPKFKVDKFKLVWFWNPASLWNLTSLGPNLQGFIKFTSLGPNLQGFLIIPNSDISSQKTSFVKTTDFEVMFIRSCCCTWDCHTYFWVINIVCHYTRIPLKEISSFHTALPHFEFVESCLRHKYGMVIYEAAHDRN